MIIDTSAIVAVLEREPERDELVHKIAAAPSPGVGAPTLAEASIVLAARGEDASLLAAFLARVEARVVSFDRLHWLAAADAWTRFGKGRHPAGLNLGDCLTYATAKVAGEPLLCKGGDFALTDLELA